MKIVPLSEGSFTVDKTKQFIPFEDLDHLASRSKGSLLVEIQPFVVITSKDVLLLDTGLGYINKSGRMQIHLNLANAGVNPSDVTKVLLSHLHKDHSGAVSMARDHAQLSFPNAKYYVQHRELEYAFEKGFPSYIIEDLEALKNSSQVTLIKEDKGRIDNYIEFEVTAAHSPFHQVFWIKDEGKTIFFGGDEAPQLEQMKHRFVAKYDFNGKKAMELRRAWWEKGHRDHWTFLFYHDTKTPMTQLES